MKIDFRKPLLSVKGEPLEYMKEGETEVCEKCKHLLGVKEPMTLEYACMEALYGMTDNDRTETGASKYARHKIARLIVEHSNEVEITSEEITMIKDRVGQWFGPAVVGAVYDILESLTDKNNGE